MGALSNINSDKIFDLVVLGGGIMGIGIAEKISEKECSIAVIEKKEIGCGGATGISGGFIRCFDFNRFYAKSTLNSFFTHKKYKNDMDFKEQGHLFLLPKRKLIEAANILSIFLEYNYPFEIFDYETVNKKFEGIKMQADEVAIWEPLAGHASPKKMAQHLKSKFINQGGDVFEKTNIIGIKRDQNDLIKINTSSGIFSAKKVISCLGAHTSMLFSKSEHNFVNKLIEKVYANDKTLKEGVCFNDYVNDIYSKPIDSETILVGLAQDVYNIDPDEKREISTEEFFRKNEALLKSRIPNYSDSEIVKRISSADSFTEKTHPEVINEENKIVIINGFNGAGFKIYPVIADYISTIL